jgi:hypothetical protein
MTEQLQAAPDRAKQLESLHASQAFQDAQQTEASRIETVSNQNAPALPQRKPELRVVTDENAAEIAQSAETAVEESEVSGIYTSQTQHSEVISPENPAGAASALETLRASGEAGLSQPSVETAGAGKRIDTSVAIDGASRAPDEVSGEHREGKHVSDVELSPDSEVQTGGEHRASTHVAETELTPDSETQTGGKHLAEQPSVELPVVKIPENKPRKFGAILKRLLKRS